VSSVGLGSGVGKHRVIAWGNQSQGFGVHASAASVGDLGIASAEMPHLGLAVTLAQSVVLPVANATQGHLAENIYDLGVANATLGHTVAAPTQTQLQILVVVSDELGHEATPNILIKNLVGVNAEMPHEATPDTLVKNVLQANATMGHEGTALQMTLTVDSATMGHNGLAVEFPTGGAANLTVVAGTMPHEGLGVEGFSPTQLEDLKLWLAPESGVTVSGALVTQWNDKSPIANHMIQVSASVMPSHTSAVANGHNVVQFISLDRRYLISTVTAGASAYTTSSKSNRAGSVVVRASAIGSTQTIFRAGRAGGNQHFQNLQIVSPGNFRYDSTTTTARVVTFGSVSVTLPHVVRWDIVSARASFWIDGVLVTAGHSVCASNEFNNAIHFTIGARADNLTGLAGWISEIIVAATAWSSSQGRELDKLLGAKYGITIT
jgi:hypothetical protein